MMHTLQKNVKESKFKGNENFDNDVFQVWKEMVFWNLAKCIMAIMAPLKIYDRIWLQNYIPFILGKMSTITS